MKKTIFDEALEALSAVLEAKVGNGEQDKFLELIDQARDGDPGSQNAVLMLGAELGGLNLQLTAVDKDSQKLKRQNEVVRENAKKVWAALNPSEPEPAATKPTAVPPAKPEPTQQKPAAKPPEKAKKPQAEPAATGGCSSSNKIELPVPAAQPPQAGTAHAELPDRIKSGDPGTIVGFSWALWHRLADASGIPEGTPADEDSFREHLKGQKKDELLVTCQTLVSACEANCPLVPPEVADTIFRLRYLGNKLPEEAQRLEVAKIVAADKPRQVRQSISRLSKETALGLKDALEQVQTEETKRRQQVADQQNQPAQPPAPPAPTVTQPAAKPAVTSPLQPAVTQKLAVQRPPAPGQVDSAKLEAERLLELTEKARKQDVQERRRLFRELKALRDEIGPEHSSALCLSDSQIKDLTRKGRSWLADEYRTKLLGLRRDRQIAVPRAQEDAARAQAASATRSIWRQPMFWLAAAAVVVALVVVGIIAVNFAQSSQLQSVDDIFAESSK